MARFLVALALVAASTDASSDAITKVVELLGGMRDKIGEEQARAVKEHEEFGEWARSRIQELEHSIERNHDEVEAAKACAADGAAKVQEHQGTITELGASIARDEKEVEQATELRNEQRKEFEASEKDLVDTVDTLMRAAQILRRAGHEGSAGTTAQLKTALTQVAGSLSVIMDAAFVDGMDKARLKGFLQKAGDDGDDDGDDDAQPSFTNPTAAAYASHSGGIVDLLAELKVKAENELNDLRKEEMKRQHAFEMLHQSLTDAVSVANRDLKTNQNGLATNQELNAKCTGDEQEQTAQLKQNEQDLVDTKQQVENESRDYQEAQASRAEETKAIEEAIHVLSGEDFTGATKRRLGLVQVKLHEDPRLHVMQVLKAAARKFQSVGLAQLALRAQDDPFAKVKGLIEQMIARLQKQAAQEADKKAYCDSESRKSAAKRDDQQGKLDNFSARLEKAEADDAALGEEIAALSGEIADLDKQVAELTEIRNQQSAAFVAAQEDFTNGLAGLNQALEVLRNFYSKKATDVSQTDSSTGVIAMLETAEADMTRLQAESKMQEETQSRDFSKFKQDSEVSRAQKESAMKAKEQEKARLGGMISDLKSDVDSTQTELTATLDYIEKLRSQCTHKPQTFAERAEKMQQEIESLHEALRILDEETASSEASAEAFLQRK